MWKKGFHSFNMVDVSPWPLTGSLSIWVVAVGFVVLFWTGSIWIALLGACVVSLVSFQWWRDVVRESTFCGNHTMNVQSSVYFGVLLFILSEVMFFFSFFFGFFFTSLSPDINLGCSWPPKGVESLSCFSMPLFNTLLLLSSGVTITWSHHALLESQLRESVTGLLMTIALGGLFIMVQYEEYFSTTFCMTDGAFGSFFFIMTGFHGLHVVVGLVFITVGVARLLLVHFSSTHNAGFEAAAWYWHFVDVVWLFLFVSVYWWGG